MEHVVGTWLSYVELNGTCIRVRDDGEHELVRGT